MEQLTRTQKPRFRARSRIGLGALTPAWIVALILAVGTPALTAATSSTVFDLAREKRIWQEAELSRERDPLARMKLRVSSGRIAAPLHEVEALRNEGRIGELILVQLAFAQHDLEELELRLHQFEDKNSPVALSSLQRELLYRWSFMIEDFASIENRCGRVGDPVPADWEDLRARAELAFRTIRVGKARKLFSEALRWAGTRRDRSRALYGLARVEYNDLNFDEALQRLEEALNLTPLFADAWHQYGLTLIRLGRTSEAVESFELAVEMAPNHEGAHYALGNGYSLENYTQLFEQQPDRFLEPHVELTHADSLLRSGRVDTAEELYRNLALSFSDQADLHLRFGSLAFSRGDWTQARREFGTALVLVPTYGRAHNGLAKALEAERAGKHPHRSTEEDSFAGTPFPDLPGIDQYVVNWHALSQRHRKRVALSVAPWGRFLPALLAGGATHYIKPLHERLSEAPGLHTLTDARISYDSRLWDDVRGCGGHQTVTGIEDVERSVFGRYNTVLHELTHQIHGVLPDARRRRIDELYWQTKARNDSQGSAFLSRYAGGSVWEYFAEGANSFMTPTRGRLDTREITRERLDEIDPKLRELVREIMERADIDSSYTVAFVGKAAQELRSGDIATALRSLEAALERNPNEPAALHARIEALLRAGRVAEAWQQSAQARAQFPLDGRFVTLAAESRLLSGATLNEVLHEFEAHRPGVRADDLPSLDMAVGSYAWATGQAREAIDSYERVLAAQRDDPLGLWGRATAEALRGNWDRAWIDYDSAIELRTGVLELRCDYSRDLIRAGLLDRARGQIDAGLLLDRTSPRVRVLLAWWHLEEGDLPTAARIAIEVLEEDPTIDLARLIAARSSGNQSWITELTAERAAPRYIFDSKRGNYRLVGVPSFLEQQLLREWFPEAARTF